ncbi:hypothetical protein [Brochothrix campestris]|uniref:Uncharacterized protein n=1 Tax=Brochothrix campestris FSL F6-1037 TaxID=1265861 RepID=W7CZE6_9LIST|nr:hypothetical protein [Brochothrix campestris]EUJ42140.1 hypothetical protein BCAMP_00035 [Brochothrix campestris FSL F6-1037]
MKKSDNFARFLLFSIVPLSQLILYFEARKFYQDKVPFIVDMKRLFNLTQLQYNLFEIISVLLYTIVSFCVMYGMYYLVITVLLKHESTALFFSLVVALSVSHLIGIWAYLIFKTFFPLVLTICQSFVLAITFLLSSFKRKHSLQTSLLLFFYSYAN